MGLSPIGREEPVGSQDVEGAAGKGGQEEDN